MVRMKLLSRIHGRSIVRGLSAAACIALALLGASPARAQTATALQDTTCAGFRQGQTLGCTSGEFTVGATFSGAGGTPGFCTAGQVFVFDASLQLSGSNTDRYDIGFYVGQQGNSPTAQTAGNICSVAVFPTSPSPWEDDDAMGANNTCGDFNGGGVAAPTVTGLKVVCAAAPGETDLTVPYVLTYRQNTGAVCTSAANVNANSKPKCNSSSAKLQVNTAPVQVGGYVDVTKQTSPDGSTQAFTYTATAAAGIAVGVEKNGTSINNFGDADQTNNNTVTFTLADGETARVYMSVVPTTTRTLTITEGNVTHWEGAAAISCVAAQGSPVFTSNNVARQITATLDTVNKGVACTITNTQRSRVSLVEQVGGRLYAADQFQLDVSGTGASTLTSSAGTSIAANLVRVTTSGTGTGNFTNASYPSFRATPGQPLTLATTMAAGSTSPASRYVTTLSCTNASTAAGATPSGSLPNNQAVSSFALTPAPNDDITCTYRHVPLALLTLSKVVVNDDGLTRTAADWTLSASGPSFITGVSGNAAVSSATVTPGTYTLSESGPSGYTQTSLACTGAADTNPADGLAIATGEVVSCTFTNNDTQVGQSLVKSSAVLDQDPDGSGTITEGDTVRYTVTMTNTGITTLTGVVVSDAKLTPGSQSCATVASGGTCVLSGTHVVTATESTAGQVVNTASVVSNEVTTPLSSNTVTTTVVPRPAPALAVVKSHSGNFSAGSTATYTLQVSNVGYGAISGTTTVTDTLDPNLHYVSATGSAWTCGVSGSPQTVTCTSAAGAASFGDMAPITLVVAVDGNIGTSVDNMASVANATINGGTPAGGNTDTATVLHPDLSTSGKTVVNLGGGSTSDVDQGDVLEYTINLVESAGATASNVHVTDTIASGLGSPTVVTLPAGATNNTSGSLLDISGITVPANSTVQVKFRVTVGSGFSPGNPIDNTAHVDNPGGPDADPQAPTLVYALSQVVSDDDKVLYLHSTGGTTILNRLPHEGNDTTGTAVGGQKDWVLSPVLSKQLVMDAGTIDVQLSLQGNGTVQVALFDGATQVGTTASQSINTGTPEVRLFQITLAASHAIAIGGTLTLRVTTNATVYDFNVDASKISFGTSTVVHVDSVDAYSTAYGAGNTIPPYFFPGDTAYVRVVASDPFGGTDVSASDTKITITNPNGATVYGPIALSMVATSGATRTLEYAVPIPSAGPLGVWTATVTAYEGTEHTIHHTSSNTFEVRGHVTLDQEWGSGAIANDAVDLQITGGNGAVAGSSTAPNVAVPATAVATGGSTVTLVQSFTSGSAGNYSASLACVRDADSVAVTVSGTGLSRQVQMPLDSSVTCTWTDTATTALTIVKLSVVYSDPINGLVNPKAIPGAIVEYQVIITNPGAAIDGDSVIVTDPLPAATNLRVADISGSGSGSGPVRFIDGAPPSGLTYTYPADVAFSDDNGSTWDYVPSDLDGDGVDPAITGIRINPKGVFNGNSTGNPNNDAQFTLKFRVRIK